MVIKNTNIIEAITRMMNDISDRNIKLLYSLKLQKYKRHNDIQKIEELFDIIVNYLRSCDNPEEPKYSEPPLFLQAGLDFISYMNKNVDSLPDITEILKENESKIKENESKIKENEKKVKENEKKVKENEEKVKESNLSNKSDFLLCTSDCQGGKSNFTICCAIKSMLSKNTPIVVVRNLTADGNKMENDIKNVSIQFGNFMKKNNVQNIEFEISTLRCEKLDSEKLHKSLKAEYPRIIVCLANSIQLNKIIDAVSTVKGSSFELYIDEVDFIDYGESDVSESLNKLKKLAVRTYGITATPLDCLLSEELKSKDNIRIKPRSDYRGYFDFQVRTLDINPDVSALNKIASYQEILKSDSNLKPYLDEFSNSKLDFAVKLNKYHPNICLLKNTIINENQDALFNGISKNYGNKLAIIVYNGKGIAIYYDGMQDTKINNVIVKPKKYTSIELPDVLQYFKDTNENKFKRILIISGLICGRCISVVSRDYEWHLTDMYYVPANSTPIPELIQSAGRLCGRNKGKSHLTLNCTLKVARALYSGLSFTNETIIRAVDNPLIKEDGCEDTLKNSVLNVPILKNKMPVGRDLTSKVKIKKNMFNLVKENDAGYDLKDYDFKRIIKHIEENKKNNENIINNIEEIGVEEYERLTKKMFPKWSNGNSKICRFMQNLDPSKIYTKNEFKVFCKTYDINDPSHLMSYNRSTSKGYGKIINKVDIGFQLYRCLNNSFLANF